MPLDIPTITFLATIMGAVIGAGTFYFARRSESHSAGKEAGAVDAKLGHIKEGVDRIEGRLNADVSRLEGRIDEQGNQLTEFAAAATRAHESAKSAHNRIDEHLEREHGKEIPRR